MEASEWGTRRPLSVTPEPEPTPQPTGPSLLSMVVDSKPAEKTPAPKSAGQQATPKAKASPSQSKSATATSSTAPSSTPSRSKGEVPKSVDEQKEYKVEADIEVSEATAKYFALRIFKVVLVGDSGAGKTTFIQQLCLGSVQPDTRSTVGVDFLSKTVKVDGQETSLKIWDTAGTERYRSISTSFLRDADGIVLMYDVTNPESFTNVHSWMNNIQDKAQPRVRVMVLGNKTDKCKDTPNAKAVSRNVGKSVADSYKCLFSEISALKGRGVEAACVSLVEALLTAKDVQLEDTRQKSESVASKDFATDAQPAKTGCCG